MDVSEAVAVGRAGVRAIGDIGGTLGGGGGGGGRGAIRSSESAGGPWTIGSLRLMLLYCRVLQTVRRGSLKNNRTHRGTNKG